LQSYTGDYNLSPSSIHNHAIILERQENQYRYPPYSLTVKDAAGHFGYTPQALYDMIYSGKLQLNEHYLKIGKRVLIIRKMFIEWMHQQSRGDHGDKS